PGDRRRDRPASARRRDPGRRDRVFGAGRPVDSAPPDRGIEIVTVPARDGRLLAEDYEKAITPQTRMILLSSVQWSNGLRVDLASFSALAGRRGVLLVADAIQHLGAMPLDVTATPVDFLVCGGHKWLNAPAGRGFLYASPRMVEQFRPPAWGYLN